MPNGFTDIVAELDHLLVEDPHAPQLEQLLEVAGDLLQARGDPRGELIALETAIAPGRADWDGQQTLLDRFCELDPALGAQLRAQLSRPGGFGLCGGRIASLHLDLRCGRADDAAVSARIDALASSLSASVHGPHLRALYIRVRRSPQVPLVFQRLCESGARLPLEVLSISSTTRPRGHRVDTDALALCETFPHLWFVTPDSELIPLLSSEPSDAHSAAALRSLDASRPSRELRVHIGRGLSSGRKRTTKAACELLGQLGPAGAVFLPTLDLLLRPQVSHAARWILSYLRSFGTWNIALLPRVERISGDAKNYELEVRRLAGRCARGLAATRDQASDPPG